MVPASELDRTDTLPVLDLSANEALPGSPAARLIEALTDEQAALERLLASSRAENAALADKLAAAGHALALAESAAAVAALPPLPLPAAPPAPPRPPGLDLPAVTLGSRLEEALTLNARYLEALQSHEWHRGIEDERVRELEDALGAAEARLATVDADRAALLSAIEALKVDRLRREPAAPALPLPAPDPAPARLAELEGVAASLGRALEAQTEAARRASAQAEALERTAGELRARVRELEAALAASERRAEEELRRARSADAALTAKAGELAEAGRRLAAVEEAARLKAAAHAPELAALAARLEQQTLLLERSRGALEERELQIRRLERASSRRALEAGAEPVAAPRPAPVTSLAIEAAPRAQLRPLDGSAPCPLVPGRRTTLGRAPENDICINDAAVSRRHAQIIVGSTGTIIEDLNSANGVGVNGRRVHCAHLRDGDLITLGSQRFEYAAAARSSARA